ncbi:MAG: 5'/3'-nucleotidase SurE [Candidatus Hydrogenedentota bacterium]
MTSPLILVTNDDGIQAPGLHILAEALDELGEVWVYAPDRQQSAVGHGVSLHRPLRVHPYNHERWYMVDGTPTDCVMLAIRHLLPRRPALVVSGINPGANLGDDVTYSGTVAGAFEGMLQGVPSLAISDVAYVPKHLKTAGQVAEKLAELVLREGLPLETLLNVNVPDLPYKKLRGIVFTRMGRRHYEDEIISRKDPRGNPYYWIGGSAPGNVAESGTDFEAVDNMSVSITPLQRDLTDHHSLESVREVTIEL